MQERRPGAKGNSLRKKPAEDDDDILPEYDFSKMKGVRGKYYPKIVPGGAIVVLSPDVAEAFPDEESVNNALRMLMKVAQARRAVKKKK